MKYNEFHAFIAGITLAILAGILYAWSENTTNGQLGRNLETLAIVLFIPGVLILLSMFIFGKKPK